MIVAVPLYNAEEGKPSENEKGWHPLYGSISKGFYTESAGRTERADHPGAVPAAYGRGLPEMGDRVGWKCRDFSGNLENLRETQTGIFM